MPGTLDRVGEQRLHARRAGDRAAMRCISLISTVTPRRLAIASISAQHVGNGGIAGRIIAGANVERQLAAARQ